MTDRYRVKRSIGGGYTVSQTDLIDDVALGAFSVAGKVIAGSMAGIGALARQSRDRRMVEAIDAMVVAADGEEFDHLLKIATAFSQKYRQQPYGPAFVSFALAGKGNINDALVALDKAVQLGLDPLEATHFRIEIYERKGDMAKLLKEYTTFVQHEETRQRGYYGRAQVLMQIGDLDQALTDVNQAISLSPDPFGYCMRGDIYQAQGQLEKALEDYTRAIRLDENDPHLLERRAEVYEVLGKTDEARTDREAAQRAGIVDQALSEARQFLNYLRAGGVKIQIARNGRDLFLSGTRLSRESDDKLRRLKPQLLQILSEE